MAPSGTFRRLLAGTTALSVPLILVGVYTAIAGFGLTCAARWPLCDGAVFGLFPANWGSFVEWFHRLIAMLFGFAIIGTLAKGWRESADRSILVPVTLATLVTPLQIVFGALTVTTYEEVVLATHFTTAIAIFGLLVVATVRTDRLLENAPHVDRIAAGAAGLLAIAVPLTPRFLFALPLEAYILYYGLVLLGLGGLLAAAVLTTGRPRLVAATGSAIVVFGLVLSRLTITAVDQSILVGTTIATVLLGIAAMLFVYGSPEEAIDRGVESARSRQAD
jgi:cytochrome c oxidase assembly protein subunit 15